MQHIEYVPFGEVFIEERNNKWNTPFLFNAKELDEETGLYYYGARYYDPRTSVWLSVDPLIYDGTFLVGNHNGGVTNSFNNNAYIYCYQNPIRLIDPNGKQSETFATNDGVKNLVIINLGYDGVDRKAGKTQADVSTDDGLVRIGAKGPNLKFIYYASSKTSSTKDDIKGSIENFKKAHPSGQVILVGHSGGGDNNIELAKDNPNIGIDLLITIDARDPSPFGWTDTNIPSNVKNAINYYQNIDPLNLISDRTMDFSSGTNGVNILSPGSNHRSIDNDQAPNIVLDINNQLLGNKPIEEAKNRKLETNTPKKNSNVINNSSASSSN